MARLTRMGERSVERLTARNVLKAIRPAGMRAVRYDRDAVMAWIKAGCPAPPRPRGKRAG